jgi:ERF superfamily
MYQSEQINELATALVKAQSLLTHAFKNRKNSHFKNAYADHASVLDACRAPLNDNGITVTQGPTFMNGGWVVTTKLLHISGQYLACDTPIINGKGDAQGFGSGMTYAKRYGLMALVGIDSSENDDDGNSACEASQKKEETEKVELITSKDAYTLTVLTSDCPPEVQYNIKKYYREKFNVSRWEDLPAVLYPTLVKNLKEKTTARAGGAGV